MVIAIYISYCQGTGQAECNGMEGEGIVLSTFVTGKASLAARGLALDYVAWVRQEYCGWPEELSRRVVLPAHMAAWTFMV